MIHNFLSNGNNVQNFQNRWEEFNTHLSSLCDRKISRVSFNRMTFAVGFFSIEKFCESVLK